MLDKLFHREWHRGSDAEFYQGPPDEFGIRESAEPLQRFVRYVKGLADAEHAKRGDDEAHYEDLYFLLRQIADAEAGESRNAGLEPYVEKLRQVEAAFPLNEGCYEAAPGGSRLFALADLSSQLIQAVVRAALTWPRANRPTGLNLVSQLAHREPVTIVTLNHDLLVEVLFEHDDWPLVDGFTEPDGDIRWFDESLLDPRGGQTRLLKLHGSINWFQLEGTNAEAVPRREGIAINGDPKRAITAEGERVRQTSVEPLFLTGVGNKVVSYNSGIYAEMVFRFHEALKTNNRIVMSGYGWGDKGINSRLLYWLQTQPDARLVLLHEDPEGLARKGNALTARFQPLCDSGKLVPVPKFLQNATLAEVQEGLR